MYYEAFQGFLPAERARSFSHCAILLQRSSTNSIYAFSSAGCINISNFSEICLHNWTVPYIFIKAFFASEMIILIFKSLLGVRTRLSNLFQQLVEFSYMHLTLDARLRLEIVQILKAKVFSNLSVSLQHFESQRSLCSNGRLSRRWMYV